MTVVEGPMFVDLLQDVDVKETKSVQFVCRVTGNPTPTVTWLKDGVSIANNPDYHTTFENGVCCLKIDETFADDSARFTCQASNVAGFAQTTALLRVQGL